MLCRYILALAALLLLAPAIISPAAAQRPGDWNRDAPRDPGLPRDADRGEWVLLGSTRVGGIGVDRDTIDVGRRDGRFARIGLEAAESPVFVVGVTVVFGNDEVQQIDLRQKLNPGERTQPLDLQGRARPIKRIEIAARAGHDFRRRAVLTVYAEQVRERENWELLGQQQVGFGVDRDVIRVGRREGRFEKIALEVSGNDIELWISGSSSSTGPHRISAFASSSVPARVRGRSTSSATIATIDRIELVYRSRPGFRGQATVAVYGLQGAGGRPPGPPPGPPPGRRPVRRPSRAGRSSAARRRASAPTTTPFRSGARRAASVPSVCGWSGPICCS